MAQRRGTGRREAASDAGRVVRSAMRVVVAVALLLAGPVTASAGPAAPAEAAVATTDLLVGDSVMAGMYADSRSALAPHVFDAKVCRRLVSSSCSYRGVTPSTALQAVIGHAGSFDRAIVVAAGYNDGSVAAAVDQIVAEARRQGVPHVVWLTYRVAGSNAGTYARHNAVLWAKASEHPELHIADWAALSAGRSDWVAGDGLHLQAAGARAMTRLIADTLAPLAPPPPPPPTRCDLAAGGEPLAATSSAPSVSAASGIVLHDRPRRVADTRGTDDGKLRAHHVLRVPLPADVASARAVVATVTAADPCAPGYLAAFACGTPLPGTSTVNMTRYGATANLAIVPVGEGAVCVYSAVTTDVVVDIVGHLAASGSRLLPVDPVRLVDTRAGRPDMLSVPDGRRGPGSVTAIPVRAVTSVDEDAVAVALNVTAAAPAGAGFLTVYPGPCSATLPTASNLNHLGGETLAVGAVARIGRDGTVCVHTHASTHLVVDLTGVVGPDGARVAPVQNVRIADTRPSASASELTISTAAGAPADHGGAIVNVAAVGEGPGFATLRPCSVGGTPDSSTVNHASKPVANLAVVGTDDGRACVYRSTTSNLIVDAVAWLVP